MVVQDSLRRELNMDPSQQETAAVNGLAPGPWSELGAAALLLAVLVTVTSMALPLPPLPVVISVVLFIGFTLLLLAAQRRTHHRFGPADRITLARAVLIVFLASLTSRPDTLTALIWPFTLLCLVALLMDGVDGHVARKTRTSSEFGARFDMELDAFFILVLCLGAMALDKAGTWVLLLGLMRYGFVLASFHWPWLNAPLQDSFRRKTVCVWQLVTLMVALLPVTPAWLATGSLGLALVLLTASFAIDIHTLYRGRHSLTSSCQASEYAGPETLPQNPRRRT